MLWTFSLKTVISQEQQKTTKIIKDYNDTNPHEINSKETVYFSFLIC